MVVRDTERSITRQPIVGARGRTKNIVIYVIIVYSCRTRRGPHGPDRKDLAVEIHFNFDVHLLRRHGSDFTPVTCGGENGKL